MELSVTFVLIVFFLGCSVGGLLVIIQRERALESVRRDFEAKVATAWLQNGQQQSQTSPTVKKTPPTQPAVLDDEAEDEANDWESLAIPPTTADAPHSHVSF